MTTQPKAPQPDGPITREEMVELFGTEMPTEAVALIWQAQPDWTLKDIRRKLREIAAATKAPPADAVRNNSHHEIAYGIVWSHSHGLDETGAASLVKDIEKALALAALSLEIENEALKGAMRVLEDGYDRIKEERDAALRPTTADRARIIEECAKVADAEEHRYMAQGPTAVNRCCAEVLRYTATAIRALSGKG